MVAIKIRKSLRWLLTIGALSVGSAGCGGSTSASGRSDAGSGSPDVLEPPRADAQASEGDVATGIDASHGSDADILGPADARASDARPADASGGTEGGTLADFQPFGEGGMVECSSGASPMCAWSTTQTSPSPFTGNNEIAACPVTYSSGGPQCTSTPTCLTCGESFGYPTAAQKGQPRWFPDGVHLAFWVSNPTQSIANTSCNRVVPGAGCNGDLWTGTVSGSTGLSFVSSSLVKWTTETADGGVLFNTTNTTQIAYAEKFGNGDGSAPQGLGCWQVRVFDYSVTGGAVTKGAEVLGSPFSPVGECVWMENSGFFDPATPSQLVVTANAPTSPWWQPQLYAINLVTGEANTFVDWATTKSDCPWNEHVHIDPTGQYVTWSSTEGNNSFDGYNGCGTKFPGNPPLDLYRANIVRAGTGTNVTLTADESSATRLTTLNELGSADRQSVCAWLGTCSNDATTPTSFSGGEGNWTDSGFYVWRIKNAAGTSAIVTLPMAP